jgi:hypothetical protein
LEGEIIRETLLVTFECLVENAGLYAIKPSQVGIDNDAPITETMNEWENATRRNPSRVRIHITFPLMLASVRQIARNVNQ